MKENQYTKTTEKASSDFIKKVIETPLLTKKEEFQYSLSWHENRDVESLHKLVEPYGKLVLSVARKFLSFGLPLNDLLQEGNLGLMVAAKKFDPHRELRFATYAKWWIRASIQDYVLRNWSIVRTGTTTHQKQLFFSLKRLRSQLTDISNIYMDEDDKKAISDKISIDIKDIEHIEQRISKSDMSLNSSLANGNDIENSYSLQDLLVDDSIDQEYSIINNENNEEISKLIHLSIKTLGPREKKIIIQRHLRSKPKTLKVLSKSMNISKERVRQIEIKAMRKLKTNLKENINKIKNFLE